LLGERQKFRVTLFKAKSLPTPRVRGLADPAAEELRKVGLIGQAARKRDMA
jgi:hypothetical protein